MSYNPWLGNLPIQYIQPYPMQQSYTIFNNLYQQQPSYPQIAPNYVPPPTYNAAVQNYENNYSQQLTNSRVVLRNKQAYQSIKKRVDNTREFKVYDSNKRKSKSMKVEKVQTVYETQHTTEKHMHTIVKSPKDDVNLEKVVINRKNFKDKRRSSSAENDKDSSSSTSVSEASSADIVPTPDTPISISITVYESYNKTATVTYSTMSTTSSTVTTPSTSDGTTPTPSTSDAPTSSTSDGTDANADNLDMSIVENACMNCVFVPYQNKPATTKIVSKGARKRLRIKMNKFNTSGSINTPSTTTSEVEVLADTTTSEVEVLADKENNDPKVTTDPLKKGEVVTVTYTTKVGTSTDTIKTGTATDTTEDNPMAVKVKVEPVVFGLPSAPAAISKSYNDYIRLEITSYGHYDTAKSAFNCNKCKRFFTAEALFETHIVREHAQTIRIKDFHVDINSYFQNLKANVNDSDKTCPLPPLAINENDKNSCNIDLSPEYEKWFEMTALKRFYCKLCENYYSSQTMVQEHLAGLKHKARAVKESAQASCDS